MLLSPDHVKLLTDRLMEKYQETQGKPFWDKNKTGDNFFRNPDRYYDLAEQIDPKQSSVKDSWLSKLFTIHRNAHRPVKLRDTILDQCCRYISGQNAVLFFKMSSSEKDYLGEYRVWWTGSTINSPNAHYQHEFDVIIGENKTELREGTKRHYQGSAAVLLSHKLHLELTNSAGTEKVYFILHIGEADQKDLTHLPGIFAAGDSGNTNPCCGPVLFERKNATVHETLIRTYFNNFRGNNLIRSWNISTTLETRRALDVAKTQPAGETETTLHQKMRLFFNKSFYLFYYKTFQSKHGREDGVGRAAVHIGDSGDSVVVHALADDRLITYRGRFSLLSQQILSFHLVTDTAERDLNIKFRIGTGQLYQFALGTYSNVGNHGEPVAGVVLLEHIPNPEGPLFALIASKNSAEYASFHPHIRQFFARRNQNLLTTPTKAIFTHDDFFQFFRNQSLKKQSPVPLVRGRSRVFIASPMSSTVKGFEELRPIVLQIIEYLRSEMQADVFYAGEKYDTKQGFKLQSYLAAQIDFRELREADHVFLIHPKYVPSSSLVEIGYALGQNKTCRIFYKDPDDLPFILQDLKQPNVVYHRFKDISDLPEIVKDIFMIENTPG